jgi:hypothetical protein
MLCSILLQNSLRRKDKDSLQNSSESFATNRELMLSPTAEHEASPPKS